MTCPPNIFVKTLRRFAVLFLFWCSEPVLASFGAGGGELGFKVMLIIAASLSVPGGLTCMLIEFFGIRWRPAQWVGWVAFVLWIASLVAFEKASIGDKLLLLFVLPPSMSLASVTLWPRWRLSVAWTVSASVFLLVLIPAITLNHGDKLDDIFGMLLGGMFTHLVLWHVGYLMGECWRRRARIATPAGSDFIAFLLLWELLRKWVAIFFQFLHALKALQPGFTRHPGFYYLLGSASLFYVVVSTLSMLGFVAPFNNQLRVTELLGLSGPSLRWLSERMICSAIAGCGSWGIAAWLRLFDAGRMAPLKLAAILFPLFVILLTFLDPTLLFG